MKHCIDSCGNVITSKYDRIKVSVKGSGECVILILGRKTSPSSILELKPLVHFLEDKYTVVTFDYLGSGSSDNYHSMRTLENITNEIHEMMELLGYAAYTMVSLAYSGLYSLYYANKYPDEVKAVIGIDSFAAAQRNDETHEEIVQFKNDVWLDFHESRFVQWMVVKAAAHYLKQAKSYSYSQEEIEIYSNGAAYMYEHMTLLDEYKCEDENFAGLENVTFSSRIPVLFILSRSRCRKIKMWQTLHKDLSPNGKIVTLSGGKNLHLTYAKRVSEEIEGFISCLGQQNFQIEPFRFY